MNRFTAILFVAIFLTARAHGDSYQVLSIGLYQTNDVLSARIPVAQLADYIKKLNATSSLYFETNPHGLPEVIEIVVVIKPSGESKFWIIDPRNKFAQERELMQELAKVEVPKPKDGPVAFCILASLWNAPDEKKLTQPGIPDQWHRAVTALQRPAVLPDDIMPMVWPDENANPNGPPAK